MRHAAVVWAATGAISIGMLALPLVVFAANAAVNIQNFAYSPTPVTVKVGDTVTWTNKDQAAHSAKFSDTFMTAVLAQGQSGSLTFTAAGTFNYICGIHGAAMQGTVIVQAAATPAPTPQPTPVPTAPPPPPPTAPLPTPVRTAAPTPVPTAPPTVAPTAAPTETAAPTTAAPAASPSASAAASATGAAAATPSPVAVQVTPAPAPPEGPGTLLIAAAVLAVLGLGAIAIVLARRA